jgi:mutator protein MutT
MRTSIRAVIPYKDGLILIHRIRKENEEIKDYYVFPGGGIEENETPEECIIREIKEELGIEIKPNVKLYETLSMERKELFFLCEYLKMCICEKETFCRKACVCLNSSSVSPGNPTIISVVIAGFSKYFLKI